MIRAFLIFLVVLLLVPASSYACSRVFPAPPGPTAEEVARQLIDEADGFVGKVEVLRFNKAAEEGQNVTFKVLKQYAGRPVRKVAVTFMPGDTCTGTYEPVLGRTIILYAEQPMFGSAVRYGDIDFSVSDEDLEKALDALKEKKAATK